MTRHSFLAVLIVSSIAWQEGHGAPLPVISLLDGSPAARPALLDQVRSALIQKLHLPFYFTVPVQSQLPLPADVVTSRSTSADPAILIDYRSTSPRRADENQLGLKLLVLDGSKREKASQVLAESGLIQDGDILLSFRPEWYGTLRYSHIQLGVSHAGVAYLDKDAAGKRVVRNLDMPMDLDTVGADKRSQLSSKHYREAATVHVVRPRDFSAAQRRNVLGWLKRLASSKVYGSKLVFNSDYANPKYREGQPMKFVGDLGRLALAMDVSAQLSMYCSEFAWSVLSLKDCDPETDKAAFRDQAAPSCIREAFAPMPVLGTQPATVGLIDGPLIMVDRLVTPQTRPAARDSLVQRLFSLANGAPEHISSGHKAVEGAILGANPQFYGMLENYYKKPGNPAVVAAFNASQKKNYSPTAFQVHALLPPESDVKAFDYVVTLAYAPAADYQKLLKAVKPRP